MKIGNVLVIAGQKSYLRSAAKVFVNFSLIFLRTEKKRKNIIHNYFAIT
jgi:hypothetical protein